MVSKTEKQLRMERLSNPDLKSTRDLRRIQAFMVESTYNCQPAHRIEEIAQVASCESSVDTLRGYIANWEKDDSLAVKDSDGINWQMPKIQQHEKASIDRLAIVNADSYYYSEDEDGSRIITPFIDGHVISGRGLITQLFTPTRIDPESGWNYEAFCQQLIEKCDLEDIEPSRREAEINRKLLKFSVLDKQKYQAELEIIVKVRAAILASAVSIYQSLLKHHLLDNSGHIIPARKNKLAEFSIDERWLPLMPLVKNYLDFFDEIGFSPSFIVKIIPESALLFKPQINLDNYHDQSSPDSHNFESTKGSSWEYN